MAWRTLLLLSVVVIAARKPKDVEEWKRPDTKTGPTQWAKREATYRWAKKQKGDQKKQKDDHKKREEEKAAQEAEEADLNEYQIMPTSRIIRRAKLYAHLDKARLGELEAELDAVYKTHKTTVAAWLDYEDTHAKDEAMIDALSEDEQVAVAEKMQTYMKQVAALVKKSLAVERKFRVPAAALIKGDNMPLHAYVADEEHLAAITQHLAALSQKGNWTEQQQKRFQSELDAYDSHQKKLFSLNQKRNEEYMRQKNLHKEMAKDIGKEAAMAKFQEAVNSPEKQRQKQQFRQQQEQAMKRRNWLESAVFKHRHEELR